MTSTKKEDFYDTEPPSSAKMTNRRSGKHVGNFKTPSQPPHVRQKCKMYVHGHLLGYFCGVLRQNCHFAVILQTKKSSHGSVHEDIFHKTYLFYGLILYCKTSEQYTN